MLSLQFNRSALERNAHALRSLCESRGLALMAVTKAVCSHPLVLALLRDCGILSVGDSNPENLAAAASLGMERCLLKAPPSAQIQEGSWDRAIISHDRTGRGEGSLMLMVELGDGKDGIPLEQLEECLTKLKSSNRSVVGTACGFSCLRGRLPDAQALEAFAAASAVVERFMGRDAVIRSAGGTVVLNWLDDAASSGVTELRVGEGLLLGWDSSLGRAVTGLEGETAILRSEVIEVREKALPPLEKPGRDAFGALSEGTGSRGWRAVLDAGALAAPAKGLRPLSEGVYVEGQTYDFLVLRLEGESRGLKPGESVDFAVDYGALSQASLNPFVKKSMA